MIKSELMSLQALPANTEAAILGRIIQLDEHALTPDAARYLLSMRLPSSDEDRVNELSEKARAGSLTESDAQELDGYLHVGSLLAVVQSKARLLLKQQAHSSPAQ